MEVEHELPDPWLLLWPFLRIVTVASAIGTICGLIPSISTPVTWEQSNASNILH